VRDSGDDDAYLAGTGVSSDRVHDGSDPADQR